MTRGLRRLAVLAVVVAAGVLTHAARANLPEASITDATVQVYGIYTTDDATCQKGLVATVPLHAKPSELNMVAAPSLGKGKVPETGIKCVVIVTGDTLRLAWKPGNYTGTTQFGTSTFNDANCNAGGTETESGMCKMSQSTPTWPAQILSDLKAVGLSPSCSGTVVFPMYLSSFSKCTGEVGRDNAIAGGCEWSLNTNVTPEGYRSNDLGQPPAFDGDPKHGIHIDPLPAKTTKFKFIVDPTPALGGNGGTSCGGIGPPRFSFEVAK